MPLFTLLSDDQNNNVQYDVSIVGGLQPDSSNTITFNAPVKFCDFIGFRLTKPARQNSDDPWEVAHLKIKLDDKVVWDDTSGLKTFNPLKAVSINAGYWKETEVYKSNCP